jgi:hypothetical protein
MAGLVLILAALRVVYTRLRPDPLIGPITGGLAALTWAGFAACAAALGALRTGAPLIDDSLGRADAMLGLDTPALIGWLTRHPGIGLLEVAYVSTVPLVFAAVVFLGWTRREIMMWELCFAFAGSAAMCALVSAFVPAVGIFDHFGMAPDVLSLLPAGAGRFYLPIFYGYRSGALNVVDIHHLEGVVTFPSFHAAMALMIAWAFRDVRWLCGPICAWSGLTLLSTIPIGGHYAVDMFAGASIWSVFNLLYRVRMQLYPLVPALRGASIASYPQDRPKVSAV